MGPRSSASGGSGRRKRTRSLRCPSCKNIVLKNEPEFPFCSERCRTIDLGKWASGAYVVASPIHDADDLIDSDTIESGSQTDSSTPRERDKRTQ